MLHTQNILEKSEHRTSRLTVYIDNRKHTKTVYRVDGRYYVKHRCEVVEVYIQYNQETGKRITNKQE